MAELFDAYGRPLTILSPREFTHRLVGGNLTSDAFSGAPKSLPWMLIPIMKS